MDNYGILQHMGFYPPTENQCVMMREDSKHNYLNIYILQDKHLNILQDKYKIIINPDSYLEGNYPHDPGGTMICQLSKYLEKLYVNITILIRSANFHQNHEIIDYQTQSKFDTQ